MQAEYVLVVAVAIALAFFLGWFSSRKAVATQAAQLRAKEEGIRELERDIHIRERNFLEERNRTELDHAESLKTAKASAFEEGRLLGNAERQRDHVNEITTQQVAFSTRINAERDQAGTEARERLRAEYELQSKLFTVQISPYVKITDVKEYFKTKFEAQTGYQYQLLINGIPAFQPHLVVERTERRAIVNEENVKELLAFAQQTAEAAVQMYFGGNGQFAKMAAARVQRVDK